MSKSTKYSNVKSTDRTNAEVAEKLATTRVDAPEERFQSSQQIAPMIDTTASVKTDGFVKKPVKSKGATLKTEKVAEVITGSGAGGPSIGGSASPAVFGLRAASFSGDTGTILGNASGTPSMGGPYQGQSRIDKRLSDANKDINYNASEQIMVEYDMIPALAESESTVGYNGNPKNVSARSQKKTGFTSAELLYDRSLDIVAKDAFVYSCGQVVKQDGVDYMDYPTVSQDIDGEVREFEQVRGNYAPREIVVEFTKDDRGAYVSAFRVEEDDLSCNEESDIIVNSSSSNQIIDMNRAELARQTIDSDAGSPTSQHFNPLGRSVQQPTATVAYLQDIENVMGAEVFASYKFANKARAHFLNRTAKDGQDLTGPAYDALYGHLCGAVDLDGILAAIQHVETDGFFSPVGMRHGSAALMIPLFDSVGKYRTKADLVNQPRGLKMHIQTADNNMNPFRCKKEFVAALNSIDTYSTIDHDYDPTAPVFVTDNIRLIHPYSWAGALEFTRDENRVKTYQSDAFQYYYAAGSGVNTYCVTVGDPILNGIAYFLDMHANEAYRALNGGNGNGTVTLHIPTVHSTLHFSLWDLLVCASTPYIIYERTNALKDILDYELFHKYPLQGNVTIADANPLNAVNYGTLSPYSAIAVKEMLPSSSIRWRFPETFIPVNEDVLMPYYFNERSYDFVNANDGRETTLRFNNTAEYTTPVVRSGMKLAGLDEFFGMSVKDQLLITDRMTRLPFDRELGAFPGYIYKYSQDSDGLIVANTSNLEGTMADYLSTPRLCGWYFDAPASLCCVYDGELEDGEWIPALGVIPDATHISLRTIRPSYRAIMYKGVYGARDKIVGESLDVGSVNVNRAQSFTQVWGMKWAGYDVQSRYFDLILSINQAIEYNNELGDHPRFVTLNNRAQFSPFVFGPYRTELDRDNNVYVTTNTATYDDPHTTLTLFSPHYMLWTLLQKLPFIINPFENSDDSRPAADPFGIAYIFGLAGFVAANYDEELYNRANRVQNEGYGYTSDPITGASPIFKDAYSYTQIG